MALVGTTLLAEHLFIGLDSAFNTSNLTTVSGETIVVIAGFNEFNGTADPTGDLTITNTGTALTYTKILNEGTDPTFSRGIVVWTAPVTTGATIQLTFDCAARQVRRINIHVESYSGFDTGDFIGHTGQDSDTTNAGSTYTFNLTGTAAATSELLAAVLVDGWTAVTPGTNWTELDDLGSSGNLGMQVQVRSAAVSSVLWNATASGTSGLVGACVEVKAASTGTSVDAGHASGTGTANNASVNVAPNAGHAAATGTANNVSVPGPSVSVDAGHASASGYAIGPNRFPYVVAVNGAALTTDDPSVTFTGYVPRAGDLILLFPSSTTVLGAVANASLPAGWVNPLGDGVEINSDAHGMACFYHLVTSGEESAVTTTYTATNALDAAETGYTQGVAIRNVEQTDPIDNSGTAQDSANTVTPSVLAAITGTSNALVDHSLVVSSVAKDATGDYGTGAPAGWTWLRNDNTNNGRWIGIRSTRTTANTNVTATNITPSAGDEYVSISVAVRQPIISASAESAAATVTANNATVSTSSSVPAGHASATGVANDATTSSTGGTTNVDAGHATGTGVADNGSVKVAADAGDAGITYVGEIGFAANTTAETFTSFVVDDVPVGDVLVLYGACDNFGTNGVATTVQVIDTAFFGDDVNTWTVLSPQAIADPGAANEGVQGFFAVCAVEYPLDQGASNEIYVLFGSTVTAKAIAVHRFSGVDTSNPVLASSYARQDNQTGQSVSVAAGTNPTAPGQIVAALVAVEGGTADSFTQDTDTTAGSWVTLDRHGAGTTTSGITLNAAYKLTTAAGAQTYDHATMLGTSRDHCAAILVLESPGAAWATGVANNATVSTTSNETADAGHATGTGTADNSSTKVAPNAGTATATGTGFDATVSTQTQTNAPAELATGTGAADTSSTKVSPNAGTATATGTANDATVSTSAAGSASAGHATGTGEAQQPTAKVSPNAGTATATGTANNATVSTDSSKSVDAGHATGTGEAFQPSIKVTFNAGHATGSGVAERPVPALMPAAGTATASSTAGAAAVALYVSAAIALATGTAYDVAGPNTPDAILLDYIVRRARPGIVNAYRPGTVRRQRPNPT